MLSSDIFHTLPFHKDWDVKCAILAFFLVYHLEEVLGQRDNSDFVSYLEIKRARYLCFYPHHRKKMMGPWHPRKRHIEIH